jgi:SAM-dependent methyltransferase
MYSSAADIYDLLHASFKDYAAEAATIAALVRHEHPNAKTALDVACGTGEHARLLNEVHGLAVDGLDLNPAFVRIARDKLPHATVFEGDMTSFALERRYDVVLSMFSSIGYARTLENVERTLRCFRDHLAPGGLVVVEPWFEPGVLQSGRAYAKAVETAGIAVCRMSCTQVDGRISRGRFEYLIGRDGGIEHASEVHELGLFTRDEMLAAFGRAGLVATHDFAGPSGRGLYVARADAI